MCLKEQATWFKVVGWLLHWRGWHQHYLLLYAHKVLCEEQALLHVCALHRQSICQLTFPPIASHWCELHSESLHLSVHLTQCALDSDSSVDFVCDSSVDFVF